MDLNLQELIVMHVSKAQGRETVGSCKIGPEKEVFQLMKNLKEKIPFKSMTRVFGQAFIALLF